MRRNQSATLAEVAERAGIGRATLHRHFAGRRDLIRALALIAIAEMDEAVDAACAGLEKVEDRLRAALGALIPLGDRHGFLAREPLEDEPEIDRAFARQMKELEAEIEAAKAEGVFDPAIATAWIREAYDHLLYAAWECVDAESLTKTQAADLAWRTLMNGVGAKP